jgi:hypothetical protein
VKARMSSASPGWRTVLRVKDILQVESVMQRSVWAWRQSRSYMIVSELSGWGPCPPGSPRLTCSLKTEYCSHLALAVTGGARVSTSRAGRCTPMPPCPAEASRIEVGIG